MATRKSGDGSRGMTNNGSERPGSYANVSGSRRKRRGKKARLSTPPPASSSSFSSSTVDESDALASSEQPIDDDALDVEGEEIARHETGRLTRPEWGVATTDHSVDDLRKQPTSSRAPRKAVGPLGMENARESEPASDAPRAPRLSTPRPTAPGRLNVVEINASERGADNSNHEHHYGDEPTLDDPFGDPFAHEHDDQSELDAAFERAAAVHGSIRESERAPALPEYALRRNDAWDGDASVPARPSLSSVFDARPSLRPSPPPVANASVSLLWWVVVSMLTAIIVAAGVIALREAKQAEKVAAPAPQLQPTPVEPEPAAVAPLSPAAPAPMIPAAEQAPVELPVPNATAPAAPPAPTAPTKPVPARAVQATPVAPVAHGPAKPAARPHAAPAPAPAVETPVQADPAPAEHLPQNPYN
jgi:hypothetical protein